MPQIQPYPPICPRCKKAMVLVVPKGTHQKEFRCPDCNQPVLHGPPAKVSLIQLISSIWHLCREAGGVNTEIDG
jgi:DNA-directed RNA polymerase subunit RPC12/RpoP